MRPTDALIHPADWHTTTVGRSVEIMRGVSWSKEQEHELPAPGRVPVIGIRNVQNRLDLTELLHLSGLTKSAAEKARVFAGCTVMVGSNGNRNRIGNAVLVGEDASFLIASFLIGARPRQGEELRPDYFYRWLSSEQVQAYLSASSEGTTGLSNLSHSFFRAMSIPLPPPAEQAAIARILDAVDTALERTRTRVERGRELKRAVLRQFFCDALGETAYAERPRKSLPPGWALLPMRRLLADDPKNGLSPESSTQPPGIPSFSIAAIRNGRVNLETRDHLKYARVEEKTADRYRIRRGDVLVVRGNANPDLVGAAGMVDCFPDGCIYPDITMRLALRTHGDSRVSGAFAVLAWNHAVVHNQLLRRAKTSNGTLKINSRDVVQVVIPVPPEKEQAEICRTIGAIDAVIDALSSVTRAQNALKMALMHDLLTGRVRVGEASTVVAS